MIKVEKLLNNATGYAYKFGDKVPLLPGLLLSEEQYLTVVIESGEVTFSIHEEVLVTQGPTIVPEPQPAPVEPTKPAIVFPKRSK